MKKPKKLYRYTVPVVHTMTWGVEVVVEAPNLKEARKLAVRLDADCAAGDSYDWDRMNLQSARLGHWQKIEREEIT